MPKMELRQTASLRQMQKLILSPTVQMSLELLQLPSMELEKLIEAELRENPLLEAEQEEPSQEEEPAEASAEAPADVSPESPAGQQDSPEASDQGAEASDDEPRRADENEDHLEFLSGLEDGEGEGQSWNPEEPWRPEAVGRITLSEHLLGQLYGMKLSDELEESSRYVIYSLDGNGLLSMGREDLAAGWDGAQDLLDRAVEVVQSLEPTGVGRFSVRESLAAQLTEKGLDGCSLEQRIVLECFDDLLERQHVRMAHRLGVSPHRIQEAIETLRHLNPYPGSDFAPDTNAVVIPDVIIEKIEGEYLAILNDSRFPTLMISERNRRILESPSTPPKEREYVRDKFRRASFFLRSIDQRQRTVRRIAEFIAAYQKGFLDSGVEALRPLTLQQAADALGYNQSTISRAINGKYVQTPQGISEMRFFFNRGLSESDEVSTRTVKDELRRIIEQEDSSDPLSDESLAKMLKARGYTVKRRTVANYRDGLGILPARQRRKY
jgi:RNA polymerase sigma-54 factor